MINIICYFIPGTAFWCLLDIVPIKNEKREVVLFLASHKDITPSKQFSGVNRLPLPGGGHANGPLSPIKDRIEGQIDEEFSSDGEDYQRIQDANGNLDPEAPANYNYGRRRSRAVLYQLSGHYKTDKSKKIHSKLSTNVSNVSTK